MPTSCIKVKLVSREGRWNEFDYPSSQFPEGTFLVTLSLLMSEPLLFSSIQGTLADGNGRREVIFTVKQSINYGNQTYDYSPTFPGSWQPSDARLRVTYRIPMSEVLLR
jgi:hypothetical protein